MKSSVSESTLKSSSNNQQKSGSGNKKSTKSRSKISKNVSSNNNISTNSNNSNSYKPTTPTSDVDSRACHTITSTSTSSATPTSTSVANTVNTVPPDTSTTRDKSNHKSYSGFGAKTVKIIWEQYDTSDTDVLSEVYDRVAEDVTYKVWELANNIKTYARHSGGKVTYDLVNEVLKDSDVAPILGPGCAEWDRIDYDETIFFDSDKIVELRDEYLKEIETKLPVQLEILPCWVMNKKNAKQLFEFASNICKAIFVSDQEAFKFGIETAAFSPHIGCCLKLIFHKCIEILAFDQKDSIIERCLKFLKAISFNPYSRDVEVRQHLFHLAEIIICLLLNSINSIKTNVQYDVHPKLDRKEESFELVKNFLENSDQEIKKDVEALNQMDVDDIRSEYEALFQMMERDGFQEREHTEDEDIKPTMDTDENIKTEETNSNNNNNNNNNNNDNNNNTSTSTNNNNNSSNNNSNNEHTPIEQTNVQIINNSDVKNFPSAFVIQDESNFNESFYNENEINLEFSPYTANMMDFKYVDLICGTIGCMSSQFGYFQTECIYIIIKRMEKFFTNRNCNYTHEEYQYISRCVRALCSLGEFAFREMIPFIYNINSESVPEWMYNDFSLAAVFLNGFEDIFLYEWLQDLCGGDKLQPYMIHSYRYHQKLITTRYASLKQATYQINPKLILKTIPKRKNVQRNIIEMFPGKAEKIKIPGKIGFKFSGCRPVLIKLKSVKNERINEKLLESFNSKITIAKRKLMKPLTNKKKVISLSNFCFTQI